MANYDKAEFTANAMFRTVVAENSINAREAVTILNGMLVEWQREAMMQMMLAKDSSEQNEEKGNAEV